MNTVFLFIIPILTIRILAEDKKFGTYEILLTSPLSPWEIILGKFLSILLFVMIGVILLLIYPFALGFYTTIEWGAILTGFLGIFFSVAFFISVGMFASSLTDNFVIVGIISFVLFILLSVISFFGNLFDNVFAKFLKEISYYDHYQSFANGLIVLNDVAYFVFGTFLWLLLAKSIVESKTWK